MVMFCCRRFMFPPLLEWCWSESSTRERRQEKGTRENGELPKISRGFLRLRGVFSGFGKMESHVGDRGGNIGKRGGVREGVTRWVGVVGTWMNPPTGSTTNGATCSTPKQGGVFLPIIPVLDLHRQWHGSACGHPEETRALPPGRHEADRRPGTLNAERSSCPAFLAYVLAYRKTSQQ